MQPAEMQAFFTALDSMIYIRILVGLFFDLRLTSNRRYLQAATEVVNIVVNFGFLLTTDKTVYFHLLVLERFSFAATNAIRMCWR